MGKYIKKHRRQFAGVALPLFLLLILGTIGVSVFPGWIKPIYGTVGAPCTNQGTDSADPLLNACDRCLGEFCSFVSTGSSQCAQSGTFGCPVCQCQNTFFTSPIGTMTLFFPTSTCGAPDDGFCQDISGGNLSNDCRTGLCTQNTSFDFDNPTGCDYDYDLTNVDCINCAPPTPPSVNCGNGVCEPDSGESFANCSIDCRVPGFTGPKLTNADPQIDNSCFNPVPFSFITFPGPPFNFLVNTECEDGDVCSQNECLPNGTCLITDPAPCSQDTADFCCPSGCNPPGSSGVCGNDATCDVDCLPPEDCEPTPSPTPTPSVSPIPPASFLETSGTSLLCSLADRGPTDLRQGLFSLASLALGLSLLLVWRRREAK